MRKDRLLKEWEHDPYFEGKKFPEGVFCPDCGAVYINGRWTWPSGEAKAVTEQHLCPACRRIRDDYPAGELILSGDYFLEHREEILNLVQNIVEEEKERSPLKRMMKVEERKDGLRLTFTDDHLARRIGEALYRAHKGELDFNYSEGDRFIRVLWRRNM